MLTWEARHAEPLTKFLARTVCIDFSDDNLVFDVRVSICDLFVDGCKVLCSESQSLSSSPMLYDTYLAVSAPRSEAINGRTS